jgi:hypothetical protein
VKGVISTAAVLVFSVATLGAADQTYEGVISDSACAAHHESGAENVPPPPAKECVENCVRGGSRYVLLTEDGKVYEIANQSIAGLKDNGGVKVKITGELKGNLLTATKVDKTQ